MLVVRSWSTCRTICAKCRALESRILTRTPPKKRNRAARALCDFRRFTREAHDILKGHIGQRCARERFKTAFSADNRKDFGSPFGVQVGRFTRPLSEHSAQTMDLSDHRATHPRS